MAGLIELATLLGFPILKSIYLTLSNLRRDLQLAEIENILKNIYFFSNFLLKLSGPLALFKD